MLSYHVVEWPFHLAYCSVSDDTGILLFNCCHGQDTGLHLHSLMLALCVRCGHTLHQLLRLDSH
jgi:hypothetical protein